MTASLPEGADEDSLTLTENGLPVQEFSVEALGKTGTAVDVMLVIDTSGSMLQPLAGRTRADVAKEAAVYRALGPTDVPVPQAIHLCTDPDILGVTARYGAGYVAAHTERRCVSSNALTSDLPCVPERPSLHLPAAR